MWIKKSVYEAMKSCADNNEHDANLFRSLLYSLQKDDVCVLLSSDFALMRRDVYDRFCDEHAVMQKKLSDTIIELEWYKNKYRETTWNELNKTVDGLYGESET